MSKYSQTVDFNLEGRFLGFVAEEGYKLKLIRLATSTGEHQVKIPKELRSFLYRTLVPGEWIQVSGHQKFEPAKGRVKLKADRIMPIASGQVGSSATVGGGNSQTGIVPVQFVQQQHRAVGEAGSVRPAPTTRQATILVCQKSDCCKRGGNAVIQALQSELADRGLAEQVTIRGTGCMKQCKAGPNVVMPDKSRYTRIRSEEVSALVDKHFPGAHERAS